MESNGWISTQEAVPPSGATVLAAHKSDPDDPKPTGMTRCRYSPPRSDDYWSGWWCLESEMNIPTELVTHWHFLPALP